VSYPNYHEKIILWRNIIFLWSDSEIKGLLPPSPPPIFCAYEHHMRQYPYISLQLGISWRWSLCTDTEVVGASL